MSGQEYSICRKADTPVQSRSFWWNAVCGEDGWELTQLRDADGELLAAMPCCVERYRGLRCLSAAPWAKYAWFYLKPVSSDRLYRRYSGQQALLQQLVEAWPATDMVRINLHPELEGSLAFRQKGLMLRRRVTYVFDAGFDASRVYAKMAPSTRNHLRNARGRVVVERGGDAGQLFAMLAQRLSKQGIRLTHSRKSLTELVKCLEREKQGCVLSGVLPDGSRCASCLLVWDERRLHFLLSGQTDEGRRQRAMYLLIWEAIKLAGRKGLTFDFDGSMLPGVEPVFRSFGARQQVYSELFWLRSRKAKWAHALYSLFP